MNDVASVVVFLEARTCEQMVERWVIFWLVLGLFLVELIVSASRHNTHSSDDNCRHMSSMRSG